MVSFPQGCHYFAFHELPTAIAAGAIHALVVQGAEILAILNEKASLCQVTATHFAGEAFDVEVSGLNTEHFTFTRLPTLVAVDDRLFRGVVGLLRMGHQMLRSVK